MLADLRGFTYIAEQLSPEDVLAIINNFLAEMTKILLRHNGTIDEFIGDAILAMFGAPVEREDHAGRAVACAVEMQKRLREFNRLRQMRNDPPIQIGIGINTGELVSGNVGSPGRYNYTVHGDAVNVAARLEQVNKELGTTLLLITHNAAIGAMAHRVLRMRSGRITEIEENARCARAAELEW